jgi:hypothetical protein
MNKIKKISLDEHTDKNYNLVVNKVKNRNRFSRQRRVKTKIQLP